jgi:hypothetical protein
LRVKYILLCSDRYCNGHHGFLPFTPAGPNPISYIICRTTLPPDLAPAHNYYYIIIIITAKACRGRLVQHFASDAIVVHGHRFGLRGCRIGVRHLVQLPPNDAKGVVYPLLSFRRWDKCIVEDCYSRYGTTGTYCISTSSRRVFH